MRHPVKIATTALSLAAVVGALAASPASAKSPKCFGNPVAGQPGVFHIVCSTNRP